MTTKDTKTKEKYFEAVGRRKTSVARVRLFGKEKGKITVNERAFEEYFPTKELQGAVLEAFDKAGLSGKFAATVKINGGGIHSQAEALRHAISRALLKFDIQTRSTLKKAGLLTRDPRAKERRKFGLKKARKAPQWSKR
ncbi:TPA: 30S ribosomal protein S9 [Patescibacteria group bacterium]|nr:MAG: 30S ribosomal protein S9 [Parcubacteria group bacterium GW2011_GWF2_40_10]KKR46785.1 MAG: 30S ribosomal protein S9 [Parcubacteria group bacterium GW2011_GWA2_40_143]KKR59689.1 MAG: 30S ribosomal protein S9 [Parcubacteria group bacterium GW2011_GWC2_40_31]KKR74582.1 MAG: 30S ribosomal protein S9 [Parcubacteria group bacterium GW2011_GWB2_40_8]KKR80698.1 MAG: 30S ribosomal protein S9 [Parcubacteria group bacterium GW2011_GWD2_40_9]HBB56561.1 30S ribosomal protein S9 [Patescibacteria grou